MGARILFKHPVRTSEPTTRVFPRDLTEVHGAQVLNPAPGNAQCCAVPARRAAGALDTSQRCARTGSGECDLRLPVFVRCPSSLTHFSSVSSITFFCGILGPNANQHVFSGQKVESRRLRGGGGVNKVTRKINAQVK